jgi:hypothetical protein
LKSRLGRFFWRFFLLQKYRIGNAGLWRHKSDIAVVLARKLPIRDIRYTVAFGGEADVLRISQISREGPISEVVRSRTCQKQDLHETMPSNSRHIVTSFCRVSADARS